MKVFGIGRLVKEADIRRNKDNLAIVNFTLAWNIGDKGYFVRCVALGKTGEAVVNYVRKGDRIYINNGELQEVRFTTESGEEKQYHEILINSFQFIENRTTTPQKETVKEEVEEDTDLPF